MAGAQLPKNVDDVYGLSPLQHGMLFHSITAPESGVYVEQLSTVITCAGLDVGRLQRCWESLTTRHSALRTAFVWEGLKDPLQVVRSRVETPWQQLDWRGRSDADRATDREALLARERALGFDLSRAPLSRMTLVRLDDDRHEWIWTRHHLIADGWSTSVLLAELACLYEQDDEAGCLVGGEFDRYRDHISSLAAKAKRRAAEDSSFWSGYLSGVRGVGGSEESHRLGEFARIDRCVDPATSQDLVQLARGQGVTLNTVCQAAWAFVMARYRGTADIVWGTTFSGRAGTVEDASTRVGLYINTLPVRLTVTADETWSEVLHELQSMTTGLMEYEHCGIGDIQRWCGLPAEESLFDSVLVFENYPRPEPAERRLSMSPPDYHEQSNLPLALIVLPGDSMELVLIHDTRRYPSPVAQRLLESYVEVLASLPALVDSPLGETPFPATAERHRLLCEWNRRCLAIPGDETVDRLIMRRAGSDPEQVAIVSGSRRISYGELESDVQHRAVALDRYGVAEGDIVPICLSRGADLLAWMFAVMRCGAAYVVVDPAHPAEYRRSIVDQCKARVGVTDVDRALGDGSLTIVAPDCVRPEEPAKMFPSRASASGMAYVLFTSGSTGIPKGVMVSHRNLLNSTLARPDYYGENPAAFVLLSPLFFDSSVAGVYWTLCGGGKLVIREGEGLTDVARTLDDMEREQVTHTLCLPGLYRALLDYAGAFSRVSALGTLKTVICAGEQMPGGELLEQHRSLAPGARLFNEYGPTETTVWCSVFEATELRGESVPIGMGIANTRLYVLDERGSVVPQGQPGELAVAGDNVAQGYLNASDEPGGPFREQRVAEVGCERLYLTGDRVRFREDGNLEYLGRMDDQLKIRGHRVEPLEIEQHIRLIPAAGEVVVFGRDHAGSVELAAVVEASGPAVTPESVTAELSDRLPNYKIPDRINVVTTLPRLPNGKVDRITAMASLVDDLPAGPESRRERPASDATKPAGPTAVILAAAAEVLGLEAVRVTDSFLALGGDSIQSIRLVAAVRRRGFSLTPADVFETADLSALAWRLESVTDYKDIVGSRWTPADSELAREHFGPDAEGMLPLTANQHTFLFAHLSLGTTDPGHMQVQATIEGALDATVFHRCWQRVVQRHDALRTAIHWSNRADPVQVIYRSADCPCPEVIDMAAKPQVLERYLENDRRQPLDLEAVPNWRLALFASAVQTCRLVWTCHHALVDGWSAAVVLREVVAAYCAEFAGRGLEVEKVLQHGDYVRWLEKKDFTRSRQFWLEMLEADREPGRTDRDAVRTVRDGVFHSTARRIDGDDFDRIARRLGHRRLTLAQLMQGLWAHTLGRLSPEDTVRFSVTVSGRSAPLDGIDRGVGQFVNHVPFQVALSPGASLDHALAVSRETALAIMPHEHTPPTAIRRWTGIEPSTAVGDGSEPHRLLSLLLVENFPWQTDRHVEHPGSIRLLSFQRRGEGDDFSENQTTGGFPLTVTAVPAQDHLDIALHADSRTYSDSAVNELLTEMCTSLIDWGHYRDRAPATGSLFVPGLLHTAGQETQASTRRSRVRIKPRSELELHLQGIWKSVLKLDAVGVDESFFELGGDSILAVSMMEAISRQLGRDLPLATLVQCDTVGRLAERLSDDTAPTWQTLVPIREKGRLTPVFGVHAEGNVLFYRDLSQLLGEDRPFYGLQSRALGGQHEPFDSIEDMAAHYVAEIRTVQQTGPYIICGMCFGAWVALEMVQQLLDLGERIEMLIVFDSSAPKLMPENRNPGLQARLRDGFWSHRSLVRTVHAARRLFLPAGRKQILQVAHHHRLLKKNYRARPYRGSTLFLRSEEFQSIPRLERHVSDWRSLTAGEFHDYLVAGGHGSILEPPQVYRVAEIVNTYLANSPEH